jgi:GT2 family glycosyltransferase
MLASVAGQTRESYELCLVDDGSRDPRVIERLGEAAFADDRIHLVRNEEALGIAGATNVALSQAGGEFVALLDHDDTLAPDALEAVAAAIVERPEADFIYSDEVLWGDGGPVWVHLKPDWSLDLMRSVMYTCHFSVYRRALVDELGGLRSEFDGSQDYDLALRVSERTDNIVHLPRPLYNWRIHGDSVTGNPNAKGYAYPAGLRALNDHLGRCGVEGEIQFGSKPGQYRVLHEVPETARVAVILPVTPGAPPDLRAAAESWSRTEHPAWELVLAGPDAVTATWARELAGTACADRLRSVSSAGAVGGPGAVNQAVAESDAEFVVLLDAPAEALTPTWLTSIVGYASERGVGVAAAKTLAADGRIEHAGLVIGDGAPLPVLHGAPATDEGPVAITVISSNFSAVSGIVAVRRSRFEDLGGLDEALRELAVPDLCLRAGERGLRIVSVPDALMRRLPGAASVNDLDAHAVFRDRWRGRLPRDPYLNPNFAASRGDYVRRESIG